MYGIMKENKGGNMKKGFTLIELLAVIVILAIILLIAMPIVLNVISEARKGAFESTAIGIAKTAENECMAQLVSGVSGEREVDFLDWEMTGETLDFSGKGAKEGTIYVDDTCQVAMAIHDDNWCVKKNYTEKEVTIVEYDGTCSLGEVVELYPYPYLQWQDGIDLDFEYPVGPLYSNSVITEMVNNESYIPIATAAELNNLRNNSAATYGSGTTWEGTYTAGLDKKYIQVANIDLSGYADWRAIGLSVDYGGANVFTGIYDGNNYIIDNLTQITGLFSNSLGEQVLGLFGMAEEATFKNIMLDNISLRGSQGIGGLLGWADGDWMNPPLEEDWTLIDNCHVRGGTILSSTDAPGQTGGGYGIGGLVGYGYYVKIINSSSAVDVTTDSGAVGGLVGDSGGIIIENSFATGDVTGSYDTGGLIGFGYNEEINNSYATGNVIGVQRGLSTSGPYFLGGFAGRINGEINNSFSTGNVTLDYEGSNGLYSIGGFTGSIYGMVNNSYATGNVICELTDCMGIGGFAGDNDGNISNSYATGNVVADVEGGGFVGWLYNDNINNCYSFGIVTGNSDMGGFIGISWSDPLPENSYYNQQTSGYSDNDGRGLPRTTAQMTYPHEAATTYVGWNFSTIWKWDQ